MEEAYNSPWYERPTQPRVCIICPGQSERDTFGHRFGSQKLILSTEQMNALIEGRQLAVSIMEDEYALFILGPGASET